MPPSPPRRYKSDQELTVDELVRRQRDPGARFETPEYLQARNAALINAGFEDDVAPATPPLNQMSTQQHLERLQRR